MLEKLDDINWKGLRHAGGEASNIPGLIRALASHDKDQRDCAYDGLYTTLFYQGRRWSASPYAISFLYELLADDSTDGKAELIKYILHLAVGYPDDWLPLGFDIDKLPFNDIAAHKCYYCVAAELSLLYPLMFSDDGKVREMAVYAASYFPLFLTESAICRIEDLSRHGSSEREKAGAILAMGIICRAKGRVYSFKELFNASRGILKAAAAISTLLNGGFASNKDEILHLLTLSGRDMDDISNRVLFYDGDMSAYISSVLGLLNGDEIPEVLDLLTEELAFIHGEAAMAVALYMLKLVKKSNNHSIREFEYLKDAEKRALSAISEYDEIWDDAHSILVSYVYPASRSEFIAYIRGEYNEGLRAFFDCRRSAESGDAQSQYCLGDIFEKGEIINQNLSAAMDWYRQAAENGVIDAVHAIGRINHFYYRNYSKAFEYYTKGMEGGQSMSMNNLGLLYENGLGVEKDIHKAVSLYRRAAELGNSIAQNNMGISYEYGTGVGQDYDEAFKWYMSGAVQGDKSAMNNVGRMYYNGTGVERNYSKAFEWYTRATNAGNGYAMSNLGYMYEHGEFVGCDYEKALAYYRESAALGVPTGQNNMGRMYYNGRAVLQDYRKAALWYRKAAVNGNKCAQNNLGHMYELGQGLEQSYEQALLWYRRAAEQNYPSAQNNLGRMYYDGTGVEQSYENARKWYLKAAEAGDIAAASNLGRVYEHGMGVEKDYAVALNWYMYGAERDDAHSQNCVGMMYHYGKGMKVNTEKAAFWYAKAIDNGSIDAMYNLGVLYNEKRNIPVALDWCIKAAEAGNTQAQNYLGEIYEHGKGVWQDDKTAVKYYKMSADSMNATGLARLAWMYFNGKGVKQDYNEAIRLYRLSGDGGNEEGYVRALEIERFMQG